jgi:hypothetical protein
VDKIRSFLATIKDGLQHYGKVVDAWREKGVHKPVNHTEERTKYILLVILKAHKVLILFFLFYFYVFNYEIGQRRDK